jgi:pimeloyl-ACP methyl ester carboxylesterase
MDPTLAHQRSEAVNRQQMSISLQPLLSSLQTNQYPENKMTKLAETLLAGSIGVATALGGVSHAQTTPPSVKNILLVHGAFADGTSWGKVIPILEARGFHVVAVQNPLTSLADDANATRRLIALQDGPVILVGHSWGGAVITEVGDDPKVVGLVYVAAWMPDVGKSANQTSEPFGPTPVLKEIRVDAQHFASLSEDGVINDFANGLPMAERRLVLAVQGQTYGPMFDEKLTHAAWRSKPSWHVISMNDRTLSPAMEEDEAKRSGGIAVKLPTCHVAMLQEPEKVADVISEAAKNSLASTKP